jgi:thiosulfate/3-mercaptopyruvate sulfurtransferase
MKKLLECSLPLVCSTEHLAPYLHQIVPIDATWYLPTAMRRDVYRDFTACHLPNARFFDIDRIRNTSTDLPHMLPSAHVFEEAMINMGVSNSDVLVIYDQQGVFSSCRAYWTFKVFGHERVSILDGGLPKWKREGRPVASGDVSVAKATAYRATYNPQLVQDYEGITQNLQSLHAQVLDARSHERFEGSIDEPRPGLRRGHVPHSINVPFSELLDSRGECFKPQDVLRNMLTPHLSHRPIITMCGSGVTASILFVALKWCGYPLPVSVYDGSWAEYGQKASEDMIETA